ncbi:MAG: AraC family transcriptional regulator [Oscillospiraceae bacterium]|nr:AraC family transcriptional regulator [Oscillospiraceae bacterium]
MQRQLAHDLRGTFIRLIGEISASVALEPNGLYTTVMGLRTHSDAAHQQRLFGQTATRLCEAVNASKLSARSEFMHRILEYIETNFSDTGLSLQSLADSFHVSQAHLSRQIKMWTGSTFSDIVEERRMRMAREYVTETSLSIAEISERCGYYIQNTFFKAFQRLFGVSPTMMRKMKKV